eukprot:TRINITY_DN2552_c0_g1_i7.p1 TRINITY_DN2552_c0_g1~~TRINITY_DN2552_c0_g1_i7.p1  ORF type:complete len:418 (-),score=99.89 TRINITY_DN2552_c0_g1_i7:158-1411(-)
MSSAAPSAGIEELDRLRTKIAVLSGRLLHAEEDIKAQRAVHSDGVAQKLRAEVASLSQALVRERKGRSREEARLKRLAQEAEENLKEQRMAVQEAEERVKRQLQAAPQGESAPSARRREQARNLAQSIAQQTLDIAGELGRLRATSDTPVPGGAIAAVGRGAAPSTPAVGGGRGRGDGGSLAPLGGEPSPLNGDPERTLQPRGVIGEAAAIQAPLSRQGPFQTRPLPAAGAVTATAEGPSSRHAIEITSGWDVFDPDESTEHTRPVAAASGASHSGQGSHWEADPPEVSPGGGRDNGRGGNREGHSSTSRDTARGAAGATSTSFVGAETSGWDDFDGVAPEDAPALGSGHGAGGAGWDADLGSILLDGDAASSPEAEALGDQISSSAAAPAPEVSQGGGAWDHDLELEEFLSGEGLC